MIILHVASDEKFINGANTHYEKAFPKQNIFLVVIPTSSYTVKYVEPRDNVEFVLYEDLTQYVNNIRDTISLVVLHSLMPSFYPVIDTALESTPIIWNFFGYEIYNDPTLYPQDTLYYKESYLAYIKPTTIDKIKDNNLLRRIYRKIINKGLSYSANEYFKRNYSKKKSIINRIDYLGLPYEEDYDKVMPLLSNSKMHLFKYWYYTLTDEFIPKEIPDLSNKNKILIGNSATVISNHLDIFKRLEHIGAHKEEYILPLSYGYEAFDYKNNLIERIPSTFKNVTILDTFIPLVAYNEILSSCKIAIIASRRQHAVGNIVSLLSSGTKVFLSKDNSFYCYLKRMGVIVFDFEKDLSIDNLTPLSEKEILNNRETLYNILNEKSLLEKLKHQVLSIVSKYN